MLLRRSDVLLLTIVPRPVSVPTTPRRPRKRIHVEDNITEQSPPVCVSAKSTKNTIIYFNKFSD